MFSHHAKDLFTQTNLFKVISSASQLIVVHNILLSTPYHCFTQLKSQQQYRSKTRHETIFHCTTPTIFTTTLLIDRRPVLLFVSVKSNIGAACSNVFTQIFTRSDKTPTRLHLRNVLCKEVTKSDQS